MESYDYETLINTRIRYICVCVCKSLNVLKIFHAYTYVMVAVTSP